MVLPRGKNQSLIEQIREGEDGIRDSIKVIPRHDRPVWDDRADQGMGT